MTAEFPGNVRDSIDQFTGRAWLLPHLLEWLGRPSERMFLITGTPGTGKSSLIAWLAGGGPAPEGDEDRRRLEAIRSRARAAHFCVSSSGSTAPKAFAQNVADQLTRAVPGFGNALAVSLSDRISIRSDQTVGTVQAGAQLTGIVIEHIDLGELGDEQSFDRTLREPLQLLYRDGYDRPLILLVDALDEAMTYTGRIDIVRLLAKLSDLPEPVRVIATTRPDSRVLNQHHRVRPFDLIARAPAGMDDVRSYALQRLKAVDEARRTDLADRIGRAAGGKFLYAKLLLDDLVRRIEGGLDPGTIRLPQGLGELYIEFLNREIGRPRKRWFRTYRALLGVIAVAQGEGLRRPAIERATESQDAEEALEVAGQYLNGHPPDGPFRLFHQSFTNFLIEDPENNVYHVDAGDMHLQVAKSYWPSGRLPTPWRGWDDYGVRFMATHLAEAARRRPVTKRHGLAGRLMRLVLDEDFRRVYRERVDDLVAYESDLRLALEAAASDVDPEALTLVVAGALALVDFRRGQSPESLFEIAHRGDIPAAVRGLDLLLYQIDEDQRERWRQAILLAIAWLGAEDCPGEAVALFDRIPGPPSAPDPLPLLRAHVEAGLGLRPPSPTGLLDAPPPPQVMEEILARISGMDADQEMIQSFTGPVELLKGVDYLARADGPALVAYAAARPAEGDKHLDTYINLHTSYNHSLYRNNSLWVLFEAVLRHPDPGWVRRRVVELATAALAGSRQDFQEALPLVILTLRAYDGRSAEAADRFREAQEDARWAKQAAQPISNSRRRDSWGFIKRRLGTIAEALTLWPGRLAERRMLLQEALEGPYGFAVFQAAACLTLAESISIADPDDPVGIRRALDSTLRAAHNIQDAWASVRFTSRCHAMRERWWAGTRPHFDAGAVIQRFTADPSAAEFAALQRVGEGYEHRASTQDRLLLPPEVRAAGTLRQIAQIYRRPLVEVQGLNRGLAEAVDEPLPLGTNVNIPDAGFATLLAARFAAAALAEPTLSASARTELIQALVPAAVTNPTALDTVLARLLLAARPADPALLERLARSAGRDPAAVPPRDRPG